MHVEYGSKKEGSNGSIIEEGMHASTESLSVEGILTENESVTGITAGCSKCKHGSV